MPELDVQKVSTTEDRSLPIFAEFDRLADRIRVEAYNLFAAAVPARVTHSTIRSRLNGTCAGPPRS